MGQTQGTRAEASQDLEERLRQVEIEHAQHVERQQQLFACAQAVLAEQTIEGLLQRIVDAARDLTGARVGTAGHGYREGAFIVGAASRAADAAPCPEGELFCIERGGIYIDLIQTSATVRLTDDEMRAHPAWWGLPEGHTTLRGLLGARLVGHDGQANGLIMVSDRAGGGEFTAEDETTLGQLAAMASLALQHIEARQEAEGQAREMTAVFDAMADGVVVFDVEGVPVRANKAALAAMGVDSVRAGAEDAAPRFTIRYPDGRPLGPEQLTVSRLRAGGRLEREPLVIVGADGDETQVFASGTPLAGGTGVVGAVVVWHDVTERQKAEEALRGSERQQRELVKSLEAERHRLAAILDSLPVGVWVADRDGRFVDKNEAADRIWAGDAPMAREVDEYIQYLTADAASGKVFKPADYAMARVLATGEAVGPEERTIRRFDGTEGAVLVSVVPIKDAQGTLTGAVGINVDITERKRAEEERERLLEENRRQREFLESLIDSVPVGIAVTRGPEHCFEMINQEYGRLTGVPEADVVGHSVAEVLPTPHAAGRFRLFDQVLHTGQPVRITEYRPALAVPRKDDYWDVNLVPLAGAEGQVEGVLAVMHDVSEQVRARQKIEELAVRDQAILESMSDGLTVFDLDGSIVEMNPAALRLHGFETMEDVRKDVREFGPEFDLFDLDGRPVAVDDWPIPRVVRGETFSGFEARVHNVRTGEEGVWSYNGTPVRDRDGNVTLGIVTIRDVTRQKEIEAGLRRQFVFLEQLISEVPMGIAVVSGPDHRYELVNPAYQAIPGTPDVPMVGCTIAEVFPAVVAKGALSMVEEVYRTHQTVGAREYAASVGPGREDTYWNVYHVPLAGAGGEVERVLILAQQVTDEVLARQRVERALAELAEERARLDAIVQNAPAGIAFVDAEARVVFTNPVADRLYARPVPYGEPYESHAAMQLCYPDGTPYEPRDLPLTRSALDGESCRDLEMAIVWPDGQRRDLLVNTAPVRGVDDVIFGAVVVFQDITERNETRRALRRARDELEERVQTRTRELVERTVELQLANENLQRVEEMLRRQNQDLLVMQHRLDKERQRYQELFDLAPDGYLLTDQVGTIQEVNRAVADLLSMSATELAAQKLDRFVDPADVPALDEHLSALGWGGAGFPLRWEMRLRPAGHAPIYAAAAATPSYSAAGEVETVRWLLRDVTREKQLQAALVQSEKLAMAGRLAASLAHEINNPLSAAMGSVELVREAVDDGQDPAQLLDILYASLARASRIVSQLRDAHRQTGPEAKQPVNVNDVVENVLFLVRKAAAAAGVEVSWERVDDLPALPLLVDGMQQVFLNLALNAVEAMEGGGHLTVRIRCADRPDRIGVEFADDGPGIAPKVQPRLFEPFETTKEKGTGLGLFISQNIVQQHGGTIEVETAEGEGTTFTVWLPI